MQFKKYKNNKIKIERQVMRNKIKMKLINNYVDIYKIIFACKFLLDRNQNASENEVALSTLNDTLKLKNSYEQMFQKLKIADISFLLLKRDLDKAIQVIPDSNYKPKTIINMLEMKKEISKTLNEVLLKYLSI